MSESKTARASAVKEKVDKNVIPDMELIRQLRAARASGIYPTTQGCDALLRAYDSALLAIANLEERADLAVNDPPGAAEGVEDAAPQA